MGDTLVVVGGNGAGMSAASKARRENADLEIVVLEAGDWVSYAACGIPYYVKDEVEELEELVAVAPETFVEARDVDLRTRHEADAIDDYIEQRNPATAGIGGGGYVGIEMAEALAGRGLSVHLFEELPHVLQPFGEKVAKIVEAHLRDQGVDLHLETAVEAFLGDATVDAVEPTTGAFPSTS